MVRVIVTELKFVNSNPRGVCCLGLGCWQWKGDGGLSICKVLLLLPWSFYGLLDVCKGLRSKTQVAQLPLIDAGACCRGSEGFEMTLETSGTCLCPSCSSRLPKANTVELADELPTLLKAFLAVLVGRVWVGPWHLWLTDEPQAVLALVRRVVFLSYLVTPRTCATPSSEGIASVTAVTKMLGLCSGLVLRLRCGLFSGVVVSVVAATMPIQYKEKSRGSFLSLALLLRTFFCCMRGRLCWGSWRWASRNIGKQMCWASHPLQLVNDKHNFLNEEKAVQRLMSFCFPEALRISRLLGPRTISHRAFGLSWARGFVCRFWVSWTGPVTGFGMLELEVRDQYHRIETRRPLPRPLGGSKK